LTQLARPDLARNRSGHDERNQPGHDERHQSAHDEARPGPVLAIPAARPAPTPGPELAQPGSAVPGWVVVTAALAPTALVAGWLVAGALQPASYSPMRQTMSVLAGQSGTDPWVMTAALVVVGSCQIATGAGLTRAGTFARPLLMITGLSTLGVALTPEPAAGPTPRHLAFAVGCVVTATIWPAVVAWHAPERSWVLRLSCCATVTVIFAGLSFWLLFAARGGVGDLGLAERATSALQGLFPLVVVLALRQSARGATDRPPLRRSG
jgi:hypothetical membrane protein